MPRTRDKTESLQKSTFFGVVNNTIIALVIMASLVISISVVGWRSGDSLHSNLKSMVANELQLVEESNLLSNTVSEVTLIASEFIANQDVSQLGYWHLLMEDAMANYEVELDVTLSRLETMKGFRLHDLMVDDLNGIVEHASSSIELAKSITTDHAQFLRGQADLDQRVREILTLFKDINESMLTNESSEVFGPLERHIIPELIRVHAETISLVAIKQHQADVVEQEKPALEQRYNAILTRLDAFDRQNTNSRAAETSTQIKTLLDLYFSDEGVLNQVLGLAELQTRGANNYKKLVWEKEAAIPYIGMLTGHANEQVDESSGTASEEFKTAANYLIGLCIFSLSVTLLISIYLPKLIRKPLQLVSLNLGGLSSGDLSKNIDYKKRDEFGLLAKDVNQTTANLRDIIANVTTGINALKNEADRNTSSAETLAKTIESQRVETEGVAAAMTEMEASFNDVARAAGFTKEKTVEAKKAVSKGKDSIDINTQQINDLSQRLQGVSDSISNVESMSHTIGGILDVIQNIAEQTNLLALNAAIEAARAGENGRGFAVVADEVRSLARKTAASTNEIGDMIKNLQHGVQTAVSEVKVSVENMQHSVERNKETENSVNEINHIVKEVVSLATQIASAADQQQATASEISKKINQISADTEDCQAAGEVLTDISHSLNELAETQDNIVKQFKL